MVDLGVDFVEHLFGEADVFVAAFKVVFAAQVGMLVKDDLIHVELV